VFTKIDIYGFIISNKIIKYSDDLKNILIGVNALLRKVAPKLSPQMEISVTGGKVKIIMKTGLFTSEDLFSIDEEFMKEIQGIWMKVILFHLIHSTLALITQEQRNWPSGHTLVVFSGHGNMK